MGMTKSSTFPNEALTPICNICGITLCYDVGYEDYKLYEEFWDNWKCEDCDPKYRYQFAKYARRNII